MIKVKICRGSSSGHGTVDIAVASDIGGFMFESSRRQLLLNFFLLTRCRRDENEMKRNAGNDRFFKIWLRY